MAVVFLLLIALLIITLSGTVKVEGDIAGKQLTISTLFSKQTFPVNQIARYYMSVYKSSRSGNVTYGRILVMKSGRKIELWPGNIAYIDSIDQCMVDNNISYRGEKDANYFFTTFFDPGS